MAELTVYEKRAASLDEVASSLRVALVMDTANSTYHLTLRAGSARDLIAAIENRDQMRVLKVKEEVYPVWFLSLMGTVLMSSLVSDAALFLAEVLR